MKNKKKIAFIAGFYLVSFIVALLLTSHVLNYERIHPSRNQGDTSLIKLYVKNSGMPVSYTHLGYAVVCQTVRFH